MQNAMSGVMAPDMAFVDADGAFGPDYLARIML